MPLLKVVVIAISLGLDVFAVGVGVGMRGPSLAQKVRIGCAFASAEVIMNLVGVVLGDLAGKAIGAIAGYIGFGALFGFGIFMIVQSIKESEEATPFDMSRGWGLVVASLSISLDSLGIGFSILYIGVPLALSLVVIFAVSIASTFAGLTLGRVVGRRAEEHAELWAGIVLALTGLGFAAAKFAHVG